jgi:hypothetical protein
VRRAEPGRGFLDTDALVVEAAGKSIPGSSLRTRGRLRGWTDALEKVTKLAAPVIQRRAAGTVKIPANRYLKPPERTS